MIANSNNLLVDYSFALNLLLEVAQNQKITHVKSKPLLKSQYRLLANDVESDINVPPFNNSAMDGFAINTSQINALERNNKPIKLLVTGSIQAGDNSEINTQADTPVAWAIMTGAPVPDFFDAVIPIENIEKQSDGLNDYILFDEDVLPGRNIRKSGTDYKINQTVITKHALIKSPQIMALATIGKSKVNVLPNVPVAIISTGNELSKQKNLNPGKIFNSNQPYLKSYCKSVNCKVKFLGKCNDNPESFNDLIDQALRKKVKIIISTGAVSMGEYDFIPQTLKLRGATTHFHKSKIRPGKPILFAELPDGTIYFGLPGNPIAAAAGMRFFVVPFIREMLGLKKESPIKANLINDLSKKQGFRTFAKAKARVNEQGRLTVEMLQDQGSYQSNSFTRANCWLILPENSSQINAGELVEILPMIPNQIII
jgi:molybdopterin molybdotransferase